MDAKDTKDAKQGCLGCLFVLLMLSIPIALSVIFDDDDDPPPPKPLPSMFVSGARVSDELRQMDTAKLGSFASTLMRLIRAHGYRCNLISGLVPMVFTRGYHVGCDNLYSYEIVDRGGNWTVTLD